ICCFLYYGEDCIRCRNVTAVQTCALPISSDFLAHQNVKALVVACNTATSIAIDDLRNMYDFPILGIEPAVKPAVQNRVRRQNKVLVLATNLTLREEQISNLVKKSDNHDIVQ